jgi:ParB family transcriptional regulator, chromosome partitioning protein
MSKNKNTFEIENIEIVPSDSKKIDNSFKKGLGRGLSSLLGESKKTTSTKLDIKDLTRNKFQPRKYFSEDGLEELTNSIRERGVIQPIVVRPDKEKNGKYEIIAGERRWLASQNAGLHEVPVVILDVSDVKSLEFAIVENVQRQDLNPIEEANGYKKLINDFNYNQESISKFIGKSRSHIANALRLLDLPNEIHSLIQKGHLTAGHARNLIGLNNASDLARKIIQKKLSVRQTEILVKQFKNKTFKVISKKDANILSLQKDLEEKTGLNVSINNKKDNSGLIYFEYNSLDQLEKLINSIKKNY